MKLFIYLFLLFAVSWNLNAQVFAPIDAIWHYSFDPDITLDDGYQRIEVIGDTVIGQNNCKILSTTNIGYNYFNQEYYEIAGEEIIIYEIDSILYYLKSNNFYVLYDYAAIQGDTFTSICYPAYCDSTFKVTIDSISYLSHNQDSLRKYHISINDEKTSYYYVDKLGYSGYILPMFNIACEEPTGPHYPGPMRCYYDGNIGLYSTGITTTCDFITGVQKEPQDSKFTLYPNPAQVSLQLSVEDGQMYSYDIRDCYGRLLDGDSFQSEITIQIADYKSGLYFVSLWSNKSALETRKFLKL